MRQQIKKYSTAGLLIIFLIVVVYLVSAQVQFKQDLANLKSQNPALTKAYDIIKAQQAWDQIQSSNLQLSIVKIGIVDSGVDATHPEFLGTLVNSTVVGAIDFGGTPASAKRDSDPDGHGTQVTGIIGANNLSGFGITLPPDSPQMNGIISGISPQLIYSLEIRKNPSFNLLFDELNAIFFQSKFSKSDVVNISLGLVNRSALTEVQKNSGLIKGQVGPIHFFITTQIYKLLFKSAPETLFIVAAGNENVNVSEATPAVLGENLPNVITTGATNLSDQRAKFNLFQESNFGNGINISAPGIGVYAPKPGGGYDKPIQIGSSIEGGFSGTSASAPMVTGVAGLIKAIRPELSPAQIKNILIKTENTDPVITEPDKPIGRRLNALKTVCDPLVGLNCAPTPPPQPSNTWQSVGPMTVERAEHTSTLLNDGRVLITGGFKGAGFTFSESASAEVFNPNTNTFSSVGNMSTPRAFHTATLLSNGKVLIVGVTKDGGNTVLNSAEIFDPLTNSFGLVGNLTTSRFFHTATLLNDGRVLIAGGNNISLKSTEIFDPSTNIFSSGSDMTVARSHHAAARLNDGRVLLVNGLITGSIMSVDIYNPSANTFTSATSSAEQLGLSINTLLNGEVLILGGKLFNQANGQAAEIFDPTNNSFAEIGPMLIFGIARNSSVLLNNGKVLFVGDSIKSQIFNPQTNIFSLTGDLNIARFTRHQLTLLKDGRALLTGGQLFSLSGFVTTSEAEVYKP